MINSKRDVVKMLFESMEQAFDELADNIWQVLDGDSVVKELRKQNTEFENTVKILREHVAAKNKEIQDLKRQELNRLNDEAAKQ